MLDDFREWLSDNLRYILLGLAIILILVIAFCLFRLFSGGKSSEEKTNSTVEAVTEAVTGAAASTETQGANEAGGTAAPATENLVKDDTAILTLMRTYYDAYVAKDAQTLESIYDPTAWAQIRDRIDTIFNDSVMESYSNLSTYSKKGPAEGSYVVYNYYDAKVSGIDTLAPSLVMLYVITDENGKLVVADQNASQEVADYLATVTSDSDVQNLRADVDQLLTQAKEEDPKLKEYIDSQTTPSSNTSSGEPADDTPSGVTGEMVATASINIRQEPSTEAAILGSVPEGFSVNVLQEVEDGWCQIDFTAEGISVQGYVRLEYLAKPETQDSDAAGSAGDAGDSGNAGSGSGEPITIL